MDRLPLVLGLLDEKDAIVSREHICSLCNVSDSSYVLGTDHMLVEAASIALFAWRVAAFELHSCGCGSISRYIGR